MFTLKVRKLFRKSLVSWLTATPQHRKPRSTFKPRLEALEERCCPTTYASLYWDPGSTNTANTAGNWDVGLGGAKATAAPGQTNGEVDYIYFDGSTMNGNKSCVWNYTPTNTLAKVTFQSGWNQQLSFNPQNGFKVNVSPSVIQGAAPTLAPSGGFGATAAITLTNNSLFVVSGSGNSSLTLQGPSTSGAIFFAGDGGTGEILENQGTVTYNGDSNLDTDFINVPVLNYSGPFNVNTGTLQVSGTDSSTQNVSFYQNNSSSAQTNIAKGGTLWASNNFQMDGGVLQTTDTNTSDTLKVGTGGQTPVDGTAYILGGTVNIAVNTNSYGKLKIIGSTSNNNPTVDVGTATLVFKVNATDNTEEDQLIIGKGNGSGSGTIVFNYNNGITTVSTTPEGDLSKNTKAISWVVIKFGSEVGNLPAINPNTKYWLRSWVGTPKYGLQITYDPTVP